MVAAGRRPIGERRATSRNVSGGVALRYPWHHGRRRPSGRDRRQGSGCRYRQEPARSARSSRTVVSRATRTRLSMRGRQAGSSTYAIWSWATYAPRAKTVVNVQLVETIGATQVWSDRLELPQHRAVDDEKRLFRASRCVCAMSSTRSSAVARTRRPGRRTQAPWILRFGPMRCG